MHKRILYLGLDPSHYKGQGEVIHYPIIKIVPRPLSDPSIHQAIKNFNDYSHIIITSKSTVAILQGYLVEMGIDLDCWKKKITLAVGQVTAKHLEACGILPGRVAQEETAEGIIQEIQRMPLEGAHFFWPHSGQARPIIQSFLSQHNICHTSCIFYDPVPQKSGILPEIGRFDEIIFTSPSTVDAFLKFYGKFPLHAELTPIGPVTAKHLAFFRQS